MPNKKRISSKATFFYKRILPLIWFGGLIAMIITTIIDQTIKGHNQMSDAMLVIMPCFMFIVGFIVMNRLVFPLADEVYDCGDTLLVKRGGREDSIRLSDVLNLSYMPLYRPPLIIMLLRWESAFGKE